MPKSENKSLDILGIKPVGDAALVITEKTTAGIGAFLSRICLPAAEEFGFLLRDKVSGWRDHSEWRRNQAASILVKAEAKVAARPNSERLRAHPRMAMLTLEHGSWTDTEAMHEAWSGLLCSACSDRPDDANLGFMTMLSSLTAAQVQILNFIVENSEFYQTTAGFVLAKPRLCTREAIFSACGITDWHIADYQVDGLRELGLLLDPSGFCPTNDLVAYRMSAYGISFFVRCQGFSGTPANYFNNASVLSSDQQITTTLDFSEIVESESPSQHPLAAQFILAV